MAAIEGGTDEPTWRRRETFALLVVLLLAGALRFFDLDIPSFKVFDEDYYVSDACTYVTEGHFFCGSEELTIWHPPVGKWLIAAGIWMFTPTPFGSRMMVALFGTLSVGVLFLLARKLLRSTVGAMIASGLLAFDLLHLVISRTAILEIFPSFFVLLALLFLVKDLEVRSGPIGKPVARDETRHWVSREIDWDRLHPLWRPLAGASMGLAIASKWTAAPMLPILIVLVLVHARSAAKVSGAHRPSATATKTEAGSITVWFVLLPALVYSMTFVGRLEGTFLALPWSEGSWYSALVERQSEMLQYHLDLRRHFSGGLAPFQSSPAWSWPLIQRPIPFAFAVRAGDYREVLALGNPLVWWPAIAALFLLGLDAVRTGRDRSSVSVVVAGLAGTYLYWLLLPPGTTNLFIYYFVAAVPFLCLAVAMLALRIASTRWGRVAVGGYLALVIGSFAFFYPVLTWRPLTPDEWRRRVPFAQCKAYEVGDKEVVAGYPFPVDLFRPAIDAYPEGLPDEGSIPLLTTRDGWCWR